MHSDTSPDNQRETLPPPGDGVDWVCPRCGAQNSTGDAVCPACGATFEAGAPIVYRPSGGLLVKIIAWVFLILLGVGGIVALVAWLATT